MKTLVLAATLVTLPAFATDKQSPIYQPAPQAQKQDQQASSDASANATSSATANTGASASSSDNSIRYEDRLQAPAVFAPAVYASGPCAYGWSAGASAPGAGLSFGKSKPDAACDRRELARVLTPLNPALALKILCADPIAAEVATPEDCRYAAPTDTSKPTVVILEDGHADLATKEQLRRAVEAAAGK